MENNLPNKNDLIAVYNAVISYHNSLVNIRFITAGLYLTASGFLVAGLFNNTYSIAKLLLPLLGFILAFIIWGLERRTYQLLENLGCLGINIESKFCLGGIGGFFDTMEHQKIDPLWPLWLFAKKDSNKKYINNEKVKWFISHSNGLNTFYGLMAAFWASMIIWQLYRICCG